MGTKVVVVDNCPTRTRRAAERLASLGCEVRCAQSGYGALHILQGYRPDWVIVSWSLEDMMLHEFAEQCKRVSSDCVLMVSIDRAQRARPRGLDDPYIDGWLPHDGGEHVWVSVLDRAHNSTEALPFQV